MKRSGTAVMVALVLAAMAVVPLAAATNVLTISPPSTAAFNVTLNGADQTGITSLAIPVSYTSNAQNKFAQSGWKITATSTVFTGTTTSRTLSTTATTVSVTDDPSCTGGNCSNPSNSISYPLTLPAGTTAPTAVTIVNAAPNTGVGSNTLTVQISVAVPANTYADTYTSVLTLAAAEGP